MGDMTDLEAQKVDVKGPILEVDAQRARWATYRQH